MNHSINFKITILILIVTSCISCKSNSKTQDKLPDYIMRIDSVMKVEYEYEIFNGSVLVAQNDAIVYEKTFGYKDISKTKKIDKSTIFNIGSIAKQFNGVAIMMLQERGLLNLDDSISKFDLDLPDWSKEVSIRHLLNYASGLPIIDYPKTTDEKAWDILRSADSLLFEPGSKFRYTNSNVFLQRRIVEKLTSQSFETFVIDNIVKPLQLKSAVFDPDETNENRTFCYGKDKEPCPKLEFISGWLWLSSGDLYKWTKAMNNNELISQKSFDILLRNPYAPKLASSLGEYFENDQLQRHDGTSYGFRSILLNDLKHHKVVILLSNNTAPRIPLGHMVHDIALGKEFSIVKKSVYDELKNIFQEDPKKGIQQYKKLKSSEKSESYMFEDPWQLNRLGYSVFNSKNLKGAIEVFMFAISEFPNNPNLYDSLGEMYFNTKQYDLALKNYKRAITLGGANGNAKKMIDKINKLLRS